MGELYKARVWKHRPPISNDQLDLVRRRTEPFLRDIERRPFGDVLCEVYMQAVRDTLQAVEAAPTHSSGGQG